MSAIAGIFHPNIPKPVAGARVQSMIDALAHRGPENRQIWTGPGIGMAQTSLAMAELEPSAQPITVDNGAIAIILDGRIDNHHGLRSELGARGHRFSTDAVSDLILAAWREWGTACLSHFHGVFALALYDRAADCLFIARDRLGEKPLFLAEISDGALIFASELKGLLAHPLFRRVPDPRGLDDYLALGFVPDDSSIMVGVRKLPAGHFLLVRRGREIPKPVQWWDVDFSNPTAASARRLQEELTERIREAIRSRVTDRKELGAFVSGGVEDAAVVAFMAEASHEAVQTFSIGFDEPEVENSGHAGVVARRFATRHRWDAAASDDLMLIEQMVEAFDEPFADAAAIGGYRLCRLAARSVNVVLSGLGAEDIFAGRGRYPVHAVEARLRRLVTGPVRHALAALERAPFLLQAGPVFHALGRSGAQAYADAMCLARPQLRSSLYSPVMRRLIEGHRPEERYATLMHRAPAHDDLSRAQYANLKLSLPADALARIDRSSMAVGLEARQPLLDHRLVEFAARIPPRLRVRQGTGKWLLKRSLEPYLPRDMLYRPEHTAIAPLSAGFRTSLGHEAAALALGSSLTTLGWFDPAALGRVAADYRSGRADHGRLLWQLLMLERSLQRLFGLGAPSSYRASTKYSPSGGALKPSAARSRA